MLKKIVALGLLIVLSLGLFVSLYACSLSQSLTGVNVETYSSSYPPNFIDHLPFIINETDVYYIVKDLTVNGDGITILANNTVLIGQGHTITGNGTGIGVNITTHSGVVVTNCNIDNFYRGIKIESKWINASHNLIAYNKILNNKNRGILVIGLRASNNVIQNNIVVNNSWGIHCDVGEYNTIYNNYVKSYKVNVCSDSKNYWNDTKIERTNVISGPCQGGNYYDNYTGQDLNGDGLGDTDLPYNCNGYILTGGDYLPLVDIIPPKYSNPTFSTSSTSYILNITWMDNVQLDKAILELDGINYTDIEKLHETLDFNEYYQVEHKITYSKSFSNLSLGTHYYRWYANDTRNHWNQTQLLSFNVTYTPTVLRTPTTPNYNENVTISATITEIPVDKALLSYIYDVTWHNVSMNRYDKTFNATIPSQPYGTFVQYKIYANDTSGNWATSVTYSYTVGDFIAPTIGSVEYIAFSLYPTIPSNTTWSEKPILVIANITEPTNASGVAKTLFSYRVNGGDWWNTTMKQNPTTGLWSVLMPGQLNNTTIEFFITGYDNAGNIATSNIITFTTETLPMGDLGGGIPPKFFHYDCKVDGKDLALFLLCFKGLGP